MIPAEVVMRRGRFAGAERNKKVGFFLDVGVTEDTLRHNEGRKCLQVYTDHNF